jgi:hypothetical protein
LVGNTKVGATDAEAISPGPGFAYDKFRVRDGYAPAIAIAKVTIAAKTTVEAASKKLPRLRVDCAARVGGKRESGAE